MRTAVTLFFLESVQAFISTTEILYTVRLQWKLAAVFSALNVLVSLLGIYVFVTSINPLLMIIPCILGNTLATVAAIRWRIKQNNKTEGM